MEPKKPEDIYKIHLENTSKHWSFTFWQAQYISDWFMHKIFNSCAISSSSIYGYCCYWWFIGQSSNVDSASQNLASSFVNGLINAGFVRDKLLTTDEGNKWIYKNKTYGDF